MNGDSQPNVIASTPVERKAMKFPTSPDAPLRPIVFDLRIESLDARDRTVYADG